MRSGLPTVFLALLILSGCAGTADEVGSGASAEPIMTESPVPQDSTVEEGVAGAEVDSTPETDADSELADDGSDGGSNSDDGMAEVGDATSPPEEFSTEDRAIQDGSDDIVELISVTVAASEDRESISFATDGGQPRWSVRYVPVVEIEGEPVLVEGASTLEVVLTGVDPSGDEGYRDTVALNLTVEQDLIREVRLASYVAGEATYAIGVTREAPFRVVTSTDQVILELQTSG